MTIKVKIELQFSLVEIQINVYSKTLLQNQN